MESTPRALTLQFLAWLAERPRSYDEVMEAWRTSCPRLSVWEDAQLAGLVELERGDGGQRRVAPSARGRALLADATAAPGGSGR